MNRLLWRFKPLSKVLSSTIASAGNLSEARYQHQAVLIPDTQGVIAFGGLGADGEVLASSELFNYTTLNWTMQASPLPR